MVGTLGRVRSNWELAVESSDCWKQLLGSLAIGVSSAVLTLPDPLS